MSTATTQPACFPFLVRTNGYVIDVKAVPVVGPKPAKPWFSGIALPRLAAMAKPRAVAAAPAKPEVSQPVPQSLFL